MALLLHKTALINFPMATTALYFFNSVIMKVSHAMPMEIVSPWKKDVMEILIVQTMTQMNKIASCYL